MESENRVKPARQEANREAVTRAALRATTEPGARRDSLRTAVFTVILAGAVVSLLLLGFLGVIGKLSLRWL